MNATPNVSAPTHEEISARARQLWLEKGRPEGQDEAIWLEAEGELVARRKVESTADAAPGNTTETVPPATSIAASSSRSSRSPARTKRGKSTDSAGIDDGALQDALDRVGSRPRSPSSVNLT